MKRLQMETPIKMAQYIWRDVSPLIPFILGSIDLNRVTCDLRK
jgi:hypothetical protein